MKKICIIGAGGFGREVLETIKSINKVKDEYEMIGFIDDDDNIIGDTINGYKVIGNTDKLNNRILENNEILYAVIAIANADIKESIANKLEGKVIWENIIHPTVVFPDSCTIGKGNIIQSFAVIGPNTVIGNHCILNLYCSLGHDAVFGNYVSIMSHCDATGEVELKDKVFLGTNVSIIPGCTIGESAKLGAGSTIFKDVKPGVTMHGHMPTEAKK